MYERRLFTESHSDNKQLILQLLFVEEDNMNGILKK